jgi:phospholipid-transporting ATPase
LTDQRPGRQKIENVNFEDETAWSHLSNPQHDNYLNLEKFLLHLALCHTIVIDEKSGRYNASSPDELALVNAGKFFGAVFMKRDEENNMVINFRGTQIKYRLLNILEFTSARKRMSVIVEDSNGDIYILTKGADSILMPRLNKEKSPDLAQTQTFID